MGAAASTSSTPPPASAEGNNLLDLKGCVGYLKWDAPADHEFPIIFDLTISKTGHGLVETSTSNPAAIGPFTTIHHGFKDVSITATGPKGESINIINADMGSLKIGINNIEQRHEITARLTIRRMMIEFADIHEPAIGEAKRSAEYWVKGLTRTLGFSAHQEPWTVAANSENTADSPDNLSAHIVLELANDESEHRIEKNFLKECDDLTERILEVLSVSVGTSLAWSIRKTFFAGLPIKLFFKSSQIVTLPIYPMFHSLNLSPALDLALSRHTPQIRKLRGLDVAIYWYLNYTPRSEAYYLHLMTALEHMVSRHSAGKSKAKFDKTKFSNQIYPPLLAAARELKEEGVLSKVDLEFLEAKLGELNRKSLRDGIEDMLADWHVQIQDLASIASIADLVTIRNRITHQGSLPDYDDNASHFWKCLEVLVELLKRIFMATWEYHGRYLSHLGSYHDAMYPPDESPKAV